ncbi:MAG: hydrogenase maturation protease [candidate division KSB1 bacterium]|nr:hydrogenase maturation protease [candidate division KSB1 bacterium]
MNFKTFCKTLFPAQPLVFVGLGNDARGDDAAGLLFLHMLNQQPEFRSAVFIRAGANPENVLQPILNAQPSMLIFIDSTDWGGAPGDIRWIDRSELDQIRISTHAFSISMVEEYLKAHRAMDIRYLGIQVRSTRTGEPICKPVRRAIKSFFTPAGESTL